jgi:endonuclease-3 related protein
VTRTTAANPATWPPPPGTPATLAEFARALLAAYGPQGWWPLLGHAGSNPTRSGSGAGYHPGDYSFPHDARQRFEICAGAILTQNTAWPNVERALRNLAATGLLAPPAILAAAPERLETAVRPAGYYRAKSRKLQAFSKLWLELDGRPPSRGQLLATWGVGPETADSMLLYAWGQPELVVDAYTNRVLLHHGFLAAPLPYARLKAFCLERLPADVPALQEFHALAVEHAKRLAQATGRLSRARREPAGAPTIPAPPGASACG